MRRLSTVERSAYDHVPAAVAARVRVQRVPLLPPGADAMTLGPLVLVRGDEMRHRTGRRELLAHELVHARQWAELGVGRFLRRYLWAYAANLRRLRRHRDAYLAIPLEEEA
ncbi:MAG: eCIS core domain-containing protein, partial [Acidimicrobiales bacterium]